jgi:hypothetical protein
MGELESAWEMSETEKEEAMVVNTVQQAEGSWQGTSRSWLELEEEEENEVYSVGTYHGEGEAGVTEWWSPDPKDLQLSEAEEEYLIDLLMGGSAADKATPGEEQALRAAGTAGHESGKGEVMKKGVPPQEKGQRSGSIPKEGTKKVVAGRKEASNERAPKEESGPCNKPEAGKGERQGPKGWAP